MPKYVLKKRDVHLDESWDVIVVGGGPAGCAAATAAAREGKRVLLLEATGVLGGMGTAGLVPWFCGYHDREKIIARGLAQQILFTLRDNTPHLRKEMAGNPLRAPSIDPELLKRIYDDLVIDAGAKVLFHTRLCSVEMAENGEVEAIVAANKSGICAFKARAYVDCTGDGDLAAWAGAPFEKGDESGDMQPATHCFTLTNMDAYTLKSGPDIHFYDPESPMHMILRSDRYPLIRELHSCYMEIGPGAYSFNTGHVFGVDNTDPENVSRALVHGRRMAAEYHKAFSENHPACTNSFLTATGSLLGVRETRRIKGDYTLTVDDYMARQSFDDEICRNSYGIDVHSSEEKAVALSHMPLEEIKKANNALTRCHKPGESMGVPYRCLTPLGLKNVLVAGRCISADREANGSIRIMACCLNTGEAAGLAAAMAAERQGDVHCVDVPKLRTALRGYGAYLPERDKS